MTETLELFMFILLNNQAKTQVHAGVKEKMCTRNFIQLTQTPSYGFTKNFVTFEGPEPTHTPETAFSTLIKSANRTTLTVLSWNNKNRNSKLKLDFNACRSRSHCRGFITIKWRPAHGRLTERHYFNKGLDLKRRLTLYFSFNISWSFLF